MTRPITPLSTEGHQEADWFIPQLVSHGEIPVLYGMRLLRLSNSERYTGYTKNLPSNVLRIADVFRIPRNPWLVAIPYFHLRIEPIVDHDDEVKTPHSDMLSKSRLIGEICWKSIVSISHSSTTSETSFCPFFFGRGSIMVDEERRETLSRTAG